ncbi:uncharacterized protein Z520_04129 [Fonsecaea multimorphosa CBS 102226]|uniref:SnoaL-like domain-containing protein n=1 Tax=Fonsecaea multimorphosa CBS 102226 TaxID=1442371 RepID=A0A0D2KUQ7_9EURO|nr:uncharacterized protein Z520_04129 [Fonsecaea multimorphosa CBS 102226]KIY00444.1 hypothetical protein Z520_04129 [Fonsecaea multimorphosa CBS 102226]OAL26958.1 hypothetical protein AYO22_03902 [Fonsecaea multimorphosa]
MGSRDNYTFANQASIPAPLDKQLPAFFRSWDDPHSNNDYLNLFAPEGQLVFGSTTTGREAIRAFRDAMIHPSNGPVVDLEHTLDKCFVLAGGNPEGGTGKQEVIVNGSLWYKLRNGRRIDVDFASLIKFTDPGKGGDLEAEFYEVYLDAHELMTAIKEMNEEGK